MRRKVKDISWFTVIIFPAILFSASLLLDKYLNGHFDSLDNANLAFGAFTGLLFAKLSEEPVY